MLRRQSRELCLQILFQKEFNAELNVESSINYFKQSFSLDDNSLSYARTITLGVLDNLETIDEKINSSSQNWKTSRMSKVDLNILRMSFFEALMLEPANQPKVVINEALEIAKKYSSLDSPTFINGVLDHLFNYQLKDSKA